MPNYKQVQFVPWLIHTGPIRMDNIAYDYSGYTEGHEDRRVEVYSQCVDIEARVAYTKEALEKALKLANPDPSILKVFIAPEFLYRGASGAYLHDLIMGWEHAPIQFNLDEPFNGPWGGLYGNLRTLVKNDLFKDWIFVFGTSVSASFSVESDSDHKCYIDPLLPGECYNMCLVQRGGKEKDCVLDTHIVTKHLKSGIDFINFCLSATVHENNTILPLNPATLIPRDIAGDLDGSSVFEFKNVQRMNNVALKFGLEVCLDHMGYLTVRDPFDNTLVRSEQGRLKNNHTYVDIQLVPSGGMSLNPASICLLPREGDKLTSYAINCDGLSSNMMGMPKPWGAHAQLWNQSADDIINPGNMLGYVITDLYNIPPNVELLSDVLTVGQFGNIYAANLWRSANEFDPNPYTRTPMGAGFITAFLPVNL